MKKRCSLFRTVHGRDGAEQPGSPGPRDVARRSVRFRTQWRRRASINRKETDDRAIQKVELSHFSQSRLPRQRSDVWQTAGMQ